MTRKNELPLPAAAARDAALAEIAALAAVFFLQSALTIV